MRPDVIDAVVVTRDSRDLVLECVGRLRSPLLKRVIVVDNGSQDGTPSVIRKLRPDVELVETGSPIGLAHAYNLGAAAGDAELVFFLNDDILATDAAIAMLAKTLASRPDAAVAAGRLVDVDNGRTQSNYQPRRFPTLSTFVATFVGLERLWPRNPITGGHRRHPLDETRVAAVDFAPGACLLVRRAAFDAVGGWDDRFEFWFEDVDLCRRLAARGCVLYVPTAPFAHVGGHSARRLSPADLVARYYAGALLYGEKHFGRVRRVGLGLFFAALGTARAITSRREPELASSYRLVARRARSLVS
jgi:N-acetylglucosaminyl-diphospho-decaprenol L-rhamnosyltransferase